MISIAFQFPAGRYHATGWDHHVNEGVVEWPPSPWRIVRALAAASYRTVPPTEPTAVQRLLRALLDAPVYRLPRASLGHTRHFMPDARSKTRVFDAFVLPDRSPDASLVVSWPDAMLDDADSRLLDRLLASLNYLGRSESWVDARRVAEDATASSDGILARPVGPNDDADVVVTLPVPLGPDAYTAWRDGFLAGQPQKAKRQPPATWWEAVHQDTGSLQKEGWSSPPGVRWVRYRLDEEPYSIRRGPRRRPDADARERVTLARFALRSAVLPRLAEALFVGERMRAALMSCCDAHPDFSGKDADGTPLRGHRHAFILPADEDGDGKLDHVVVWARQGFDDGPRRALEGIRRLWGEGQHDIHIVLVGLFDWPGNDSPAAQAVVDGRNSVACYGGLRRDTKDGRSAHLGPARIWESHTPFVLTRHVKARRGEVRDAPEEQLRRALDSLGLPAPVDVQRIHSPFGQPNLRWHRFRRERNGGGAHAAGAPGFGFRVTFEAPVLGPIAVGYGAHQGLGQFVACER